MNATVTKEEIRQEAADLGIDLVGFTTSERLEKKLPEPVRPSQVSEYLQDLPAGLHAEITAETVSIRNHGGRQF